MTGQTVPVEIIGGFSATLSGSEYGKSEPVLIERDEILFWVSEIFGTEAAARYDNPNTWGDFPAFFDKSGWRITTTEQGWYFSL